MKLNYFIISFFIVFLTSIHVNADNNNMPDNTSSNCNHQWTEWTRYEESGNDHDVCHCGYEKLLYFRYCPNCHQYDYKTETGTKYIDHIWGEWIVINKATPFLTGLRERYCKCGNGQKVCSCEQTEIIPKRKMTANEKKVYTISKKLFTYARSYNINKMNACFTSKQPSSFFTDNNYMASYCRKYNKKKLKVTPVDVAVKGNKATMTFTVTYPDAYKSLLKSCEAMNWNGHSYHNKKGQAKMKAYVKKYTKKYGVKKITKTIKLSLKKTKKKGWKISTSSTALKNAINCNYRTAFKDAK